MRAYSGFAEVYDLFMDNVPYEAWCGFITGQLEEYGINGGLVLELGCGTGRMTRLLSRQGYDMIGLDLSSEMLSIAAEQVKKEDTILYLNQDMREFELYGTVRAVVSVCDSMNYILEEKELCRVVTLVNNYLDPGGIFIFDLNTIYKYKEVLGEATISENRDEGSFIWENYYDEESGINEYDLTLFIEEESGLYRKYEETHYQRGYSLETVKALIKKGGMEFIRAYDAQTGKAAGEKSERIFILAQQKGEKKGGME